MMDDHAGENIVEAKQITKKYGSVLALDKVDIHVKRGSVYGLIGDNGAGKSTFLKLLAGHVFADSGEVSLFGCHEERELMRCRRRMGVMVERPGFYPDMTVEGMLQYCRIQKGIPQRGKVEEMLRLADIWEKRRAKCRKLSLGQKQRLGLAMAMMGEPELLVLDEPINGLDPSGIMEFRNLLLRLNRERGITLLISSHILPELQQTATVFGFLSRGRLLEELSADRLQEKCEDYLDIAVSDPEVYAALLSGRFPEEACQILPDRTLRIRGHRREPEAYSRLAAEHGIDIRGLERRHASLEDYYMSLKERK